MKPLFTKEDPLAFNVEQTQQASRALSSITKENYSLSMPNYQLTLLMIWHELWGTFSKENLPLTDVLRLNGALELLGKVMRVQSILSRKALVRFRYWVTSMTDFHLSKNQQLERIDTQKIIITATCAHNAKELIQ